MFGAWAAKAGAVLNAQIAVPASMVLVKKFIGFPSKDGALGSFGLL
jgi:hypothetical protein